MKRILLIFFLLTFLLASFKAYAEVTQNIDTVETTLESPGGNLAPGVFKSPFKCGQGTYVGRTYAGHSQYSVDFNSTDGSDRGDPVLASANGTVVEVITSNGQVKIRHSGGFYTWYAHMRNVRVRVGETVKLGQQIGEISDVGRASGPHLHVNHARGTADGTQIQVKYDGVPYSASVFRPSHDVYGPGIKGSCQVVASSGGKPSPPIVRKQDIVQWGQVIAFSLERLKSCTIYNRQVNKISNNGFTVPIRGGTCSGRGKSTFLCTDMIISSYNLAGYRNSLSENTFLMVQAWEKLPGYKVIRDVGNQSAINQLKPGDAIFLFVPPFQLYGLKHVVLVKEVRVDSNGSGQIKILQANGVAPEFSYPVRNWRIGYNYRGNKNSVIYFGIRPR